MHFSFLLLALSTLAAAGPLPPFLKAGLVTRTSPSAPANYTLGSDSVAALAQLKAVYDSLNQTEPSSTLKVKRDFWDWIKDMFKAPGLKARSPVPTSTPDDNPLDSNPLEPFTKLEAFYDSLYEKRTENEAMAKRDFWHWLKMTFEAPGLKARSSVPASSPNGNSSDPIATLTKLKAFYDSFNEKRTDSGVEAKSGSWKWLKDTCEQGQKTRSLDDHSPIYGDSTDACIVEK